MNNNFISCIAAIISVIIFVIFAAFLLGGFIYLLWPAVVPAVFPRLVAEGYIVAKPSFLLSLGIAMLCAALFSVRLNSK